MLFSVQPYSSIHIIFQMMEDELFQTPPPQEHLFFKQAKLQIHRGDKIQLRRLKLIQNLHFLLSSCILPTERELWLHSKLALWKSPLRTSESSPKRSSEAEVWQELFYTFHLIIPPLELLLQADKQCEMDDDPSLIKGPPCHRRL